MGDRELLHQPVLCCTTVTSWCEYSNKVYDVEIHSCKFYLPVAFPLSTVYGTFFLHISTMSFIDFLLQLSTYTPVPFQKNMAHKNTSQRAIPLARSEEVKCQKHCQRCLIFSGRLSANIQQRSSTVEDTMVFAQYSCVQKASERRNVPSHCPRKYWCFYSREREMVRQGMWSFVRLQYEIPLFSGQVINSTWVAF